MSWRGKVLVTDLWRALPTVHGCVGIKASKGKKGVCIIKGKKETGNLLGCPEWFLAACPQQITVLYLSPHPGMFDDQSFPVFHLPPPGAPLFVMSTAQPSLDRLLYNPFTLLCRSRHWSRNPLEMEVPFTLWFNTRYPLTFLIHPILAYGTSQALLKTYHWRRMGHWCFLGARRQPPVLSQIVWNDQHPQSILTVIFIYSHIAEI